MNELQLFRQWQNTLRSKAAEYEHEARKAGRAVTSPSLDTICNEIDAYITGRGLEPLFTYTIAEPEREDVR